MGYIKKSMELLLEDMQSKMIVEDVKDRSSKERFSAVGILTIIYSVLFGVCIYKNASGITTIILSVATVLYLTYCSNRLKTMVPQLYEKQNINNKKIYPYLAGIILLGISTSCTADESIITVNYIFTALLILVSLIKLFCEDSCWRFGKYINVMKSIFFAPLMSIGIFMDDYTALRNTKEKNKNSKVKYVVAGIFISIPVLLVIVVLLASADAVFDRLVFSIIGDISISGDLIGFLIFILCVLTYFYGVMTKMSENDIDEKVVDKRTREPIIGITFIGIITFVYLVFSVIQIMYLFASDLMLPDGYTYSSFAREGFFQLLFVSLLNLLIVLICLSSFRKNRVLDIVLTVMCGCTYIMIASSAIKMLMYIKTYDALTYLRLLVLLALLMIAVVMTGVIISIYNPNFKLVNYTVLAVGIIYIAFSFSKPEYIIAKYNIYNSSYENEIDGELNYLLRYYLLELGPDAAPAIYDFVEEVYASPDVSLSHELKYDLDAYFRGIENTKGNYSTVRGFNFSRYSAYKCVDDYKRLTK